GDTVTITGTNLNGAAAVKFGSTAATITTDSATQIKVTSPPTGAAGVVDVTVTTIGGTSATSPADQYTYTNAPTVNAVAPSAGPTGGGTSVTITGSNFVSGSSTVNFGSTPAPSVSVK